VRASFWRPLSRRGFVGTGSYPAPSRTLSGGLSALPSALLPLDGTGIAADHSTDIAADDGALAGNRDIETSAAPDPP